MSIFKPNMAKNRNVVEFPKKFNYIKVGLFSILSSLNAPPGTSTEEHNVFCAQIVNYLLGDGLQKPETDLPIEAQELIIKVQPSIPKQAKDLMSSANKEFRETIVYTLRMRLVVNQLLHGTEWLETYEGKNVWALLQDYGLEFPEEVSPKMFDTIVARVANQVNKLNSK